MSRPTSGLFIIKDNVGEAFKTSVIQLFALVKSHD